MTSVSRRARLASLVALAPALLAGTAGCASAVDGHGTAPSAAAAGSSGDFPTAGAATATTPVAPTTAVATSTSASAAPRLASSDITTIHFTTPKGFVRSYIFHPVTPLEPITRSYYFVPSNERNGLDVMSITLYVLPRTAHVDTVARQKALVGSFNRRAHASVQHGIHVDVVAGWAAIQENATEPPDYHYASWYVFGRRHFVQVSCQVDQQVNKIAHGCQSLLDSMRLG